MTQENNTIKRVKNPYADEEIFDEIEEWVRWDDDEHVFKVSKNFRDQFFCDYKKSQYGSKNYFINVHEYSKDMYGDYEWRKKRLAINSIRLYASIMRALKKSDENDELKDKKFFYAVIRRINGEKQSDITYVSHTKYKKAMQLLQKKINI